ncbi:MULTISPECIES: STAS domain-containing protein [unclassified Leptolyngbya]|uniref:STAS domain-containing protein n=1 Tax=unclassified Leptolyngbya TaxID=2650499 RepID=UPI00168230D4|nr:MULTISPECIES: STAS domain-containing protein [unclassified Leptolyngbya]MBD1910080.1 STAS domain-containing protein [Leptolyngbya sp. FACHB-8]MBD2158753.1 STAS domain-containing protein [Leptolyngbya sp. FACHB-16]
MAKIDVFKPTRMLSASNASDLTSWIRQKLDAGSKHLVIDMRNVMFMDSSGLGSLVAARRMAYERGAVLVLTSLYGQAHMLLELAGVERLFPLFSTVDDYRSSLPEEASL